MEPPREYRKVRVDEDLPIVLKQGKKSFTNHPINRYVSYCELNKDYKHFILFLSSSMILKNVDEARQDHRWMKVMEEDMTALIGNETRVVVDIHDSVYLVSCKWI